MTPILFKRFGVLRFSFHALFCFAFGTMLAGCASATTASSTPPLLALTSPAPIVAAGNVDDRSADVVVYADDTVVPLRSIPTKTAPHMLAINPLDARIYASRAGEVDVIDPGSTSVSFTLPMHESDVLAIACDLKGNLYVAKETGRADSIDVYSASGRTLLRTITNQLQTPTSMVVDKAGTLYVGNELGGDSDTGFVGVYPPDATEQTRKLAGIGRPRALAVDSQDNVYVLDDTADRVSVFKPNASMRFRTISGGLSAPTQMTLSERTDTLYVGNASTRSWPTAILAYELTTGELRGQVHQTTLLGMSAGASGHLYAVEARGGTTSTFGQLFGYSGRLSGQVRIRDGVHSVTSVATSL